jgi:hypothetical protein
VGPRAGAKVFGEEENKLYALLRYYAALSDSPVPTFQDNLSVPYLFFLYFLTLEDGADRLSLHVGIGIPLNAA